VVIPIVPAPVPEIRPPFTIPLLVMTVELASGKVKVRKAVGPVTAKIPSPTSVNGWPGFGVTPKAIVTTEKVTPKSKRVVKNMLNLVEDFFILI
jgi:hypothetical protein